MRGLQNTLFDNDVPSDGPFQHKMQQIQDWYAEHWRRDSSQREHIRLINNIETLKGKRDSFQTYEPNRYTLQRLGDLREANGLSRYERERERGR